MDCCKKKWYNHFFLIKRYLFLIVFKPPHFPPNLHKIHCGIKNATFWTNMLLIFSSYSCRSSYSTDDKVQIRNYCLIYCIQKHIHFSHILVEAQRLVISRSNLRCRLYFPLLQRWEWIAKSSPGHTQSKCFSMSGTCSPLSKSLGYCDSY